MTGIKRTNLKKYFNMNNLIPKKIGRYKGYEQYYYVKYVDETLCTT